MHKSPLIISGIGRSGTSAVISSMSKHKHVVEPDRVGEAPFINHFIKFLLEYEDLSPHKDYHLANYQLDAFGRDELFSNLLSQLQYGFDIDSTSPEKKYWIAKVSLNPESYKKAHNIFSELKIIYVMRNGIEVVNSAKSFKGFKDLPFDELCKRWAVHLKECRYVHHSENCSVIRHDELVVDPVSVFSNVYKDLKLEPDDAPAEFITSTLFNSSFDKSAKLESTSEVFKKRLDCWHDWSEDQKSVFIEICDPLMSEYGFTRPYAKDASAEVFVNQATKNLSTDNKVKTAQVSPKVIDLIRPHMSPPQFDYHANPSPKYSYLFMENPKVASTSTLKILQNHENSDVAQGMKNSHLRDESPLPRLSSLSEAEQLRFIKSGEVKRFTFVRNPYSRLLSAYLSKIDAPLRPKADILATIKGVNKSEINDLSEVVEFPKFVEIVCSQSVRQMNVHWKNQTDQILFDKLEYSFIGKFENLQADISKLEKYLFNSVSNTLEKSKNLTDADSQLTSYYTPDIADMVYQKFYNDFHAFEYNREIDCTLAA